jgi:hypothetical protein
MSFLTPDDVDDSPVLEFPPTLIKRKNAQPMPEFGFNDFK